MYQEYADEIFRYSLLHVHDDALAEDITADTFLRAWKHFDNFDHKQPRAWLYSIARNRMTDHWRKKPTVELDTELLDEDSAHDPVRFAEKALAKDQVHAAMDKLPVKVRSVIHLRCIEGMHVKEVAVALGVSEANVRVMQHRGLRALKDLL